MLLLLLRILFLLFHLLFELAARQFKIELRIHIVRIDLQRLLVALDRFLVVLHPEQRVTQIVVGLSFSIDIGGVQRSLILVNSFFIAAVIMQGAGHVVLKFRRFRKIGLSIVIVLQGFPVITAGHSLIAFFHFIEKTLTGHRTGENQHQKNTSYHNN